MLPHQELSSNPLALFPELLVAGRCVGDADKFRAVIIRCFNGIYPWQPVLEDLPCHVLSRPHEVARDGKSTG